MTQQVPLWTSLLIAVAGGLLGGIATVSGQYWITRNNTAISREEQRSALRRDRRDAIYAFLEAAQEFDKHVDKKYRTHMLDDAQARSAMHQMWYRRNCLKVLCTQPLAEAANRFTWRMHNALWQGVPPGYSDVYKYMSEERDPFIAEATHELYSRKIYESEQPNR